MIKAVFFDIDGTLITSRNQVLPSTIDSLHRLRAQKIPVGIATGRGPHMLPKAVRRLPMDYYIFYNGQLIYNRQGEVLSATPFPFDAKTQLLAYAQAQRIPLLLQTADKTYGNAMMKMAQSELLLPMVHYMKDNTNDQFIQQLHQLKKFVPASRYLQKYRTLHPVYQAVFLQSATQDELLQQDLPQFNVTRSNPFTVEIVNRDASKVSGIQKVSKQCGLTLDEILFFGDNYNDMEVMKKVRHGVAMANAIRELREVSSFVTTSNENDGIRNALKYFHLI